MAKKNGAEEKISRLNRLYSILSKVNEAIVRIREPEELYREVCRIGVEEGGLVMVWVGFVDHATKNVKPVAFQGMEADYLNSIRISVEDIPEGRGPTGKSIREGKYNICTDFEHDPRMSPWSEKGVRRGYRSSAAFPLKVAEKFEGALTLYAREKNYFDREEISLLQQMAADLSFAIEFNEQEKKRRDAEIALRDSEERFRTLFNLANDALFVISLSAAGTQMNYIEVNDAACRLLGYSRAELLKMPPLNLVTPERLGTIPAVIDRLIAGSHLIYEQEYVSKEGMRIPVEISAHLFDYKGNQTILSIARDIRERKKAELELSKYREHLEELVTERTAQLETSIRQLRAKNVELEEFAYKVSHELKNNLLAIGRLMEISQNNAAFLMEKSSFIKESSEKLITFVDRTLELAKSGKSISEKTELTMEDLIAGLFNRMKPPDIKGEISILKPFPLIFADRDAMEQVFSNLISNSIRYRDPGKALLSIDVAWQRNAESIEILFRDNGSGIEREILHRIFDVAFTTNLRDGHGFGLAIVRKIAEAHGGSINVESEGKGKGTLFVIALPQRQE